MRRTKRKKGPCGPFLFLIFLVCTSIHAHDNKLANAYYNLAQALQESNNTEEAVTNYQKALQIDPTHLPTLLGIGTLYVKNKQYDKAIAFLEIRLKIDDQCCHTHFNLANAWQNKKNIEKAKEHYKRAITVDPNYMPAYQSLISILQEDEAIQTCKKALKKNENHAEIRKTLIDLLIKKKKLDKALQHCNKLISIQPLHTQFHIKKAYILTLQNKFDQAIHIFETILKNQPNNTNILYNIAYLHKKNGQYEKAIHLFKNIEEHDPGNEKIMLSLAQSYLALGYYKQGWCCMHQYNSKKPSHVHLRHIADIVDKIILIQGELYSDQMIQLIRYAKLIKEKGAQKVIVQSPDQLVPLLTQCPYIDEIISIHTRDTCPFHKLVQITSLAHLFDTTLQNVPSDTPYLFAKKEQLTFWKETFQKDERIKIGLYITKEFEIPIEKVMEIANIENTSVYVLNNVTDADYLEHVENTTIIHSFGKGFSENADDILQLAAILPNLDLVICCDSFVAHLAGALAVPTYVMLPHVCSWQWPAKLDKTPWYPTIKLFRQKENWEATIKNIAVTLEQNLLMQYN